jgi:nitroreductase
MEVLQALDARHSVRGFLATPIADATLRALFSAAQRAPSWCNIQPWRVWVSSGETTAKLAAALLAACSEDPQGAPAIPFPSHYPEPYGTERRECAKALYTAMGIARGDKDARAAAFQANYRAFGAPHIAMVAYDAHFGVYGALDVGCYLQSLLLAAQDMGISTCAQAALACYPKAVRSVLSIPESLTILCGVAIGYEDPAIAANRCRTTRSPLEANVQFE